ncbi:aminotransferase class III-fold pyridoxal phosphate-dependent enzyme [Marinicella litoralis]|uniref:Hydroxylysine kinase /5-phosphonooxy-L-lysine phospho-lyase n=1 Tax=Marinicella litoralis TaxID=644220 RepID=A0A4R6XZU4_9GAMM|nr:aminotransferase class III-fold pyridoxal phosphate-dependent enzyme [Marinicella litoralis]TDR23874.1 hydroxylysine kinase /5-phosphonooxy-L-lysine phospho-lyase [Marinicella litoralis]
MQPTNPISTEQIQIWLNTHCGIKGQVSELVGDVDHNYRCQSDTQAYTVKIAHVSDLSEFAFETALLQHIADSADPSLSLPLPVLNKDDNWLSVVSQHNDQLTVMRVLKWVEGSLWSEYSPHAEPLLTHLGHQTARLNLSLQHFEHPDATRPFEWDLAQCLWVKNYSDLFTADQCITLKHFIGLFEAQENNYQSLRKQVIHNDLNDNNVLLQTDEKDRPHVNGFIDFGDAICTQLINELAIAVAYGIMHKADPLLAAAQIVQGYHQINPLQDEELVQLYQLVGMRLVVSVTQAAIAKTKNPDNAYKTISEQAAWHVLNLWKNIHPRFAYYQFRAVCGFSPHPEQQTLESHLLQTKVTLSQMFPEHHNKPHVHVVDLSVGSTLLGAAAEYEDHDHQSFKIDQLQKKVPDHFLAGGYCEARSFYASDAFSIEGNTGKEYRTMHLGLDVWLPAKTAIHAPLAGKVVGLHNNAFKRDYGPTIILAHEYTLASGKPALFYTLYGHLSQTTLELHTVGDDIQSGQLLAWVGEPHENGGWSPHLHFQIVHDLLGKINDFPGACTPNHLSVMKGICPNPKHLFSYLEPASTQIQNNHKLIEYRHNHLGKSLSLAYSEPIQMLRGDDVYLIDHLGQKYLDTCNNVAHVGHEQPQVVAAGQAQMAVLNTNSRYLHPAIVEFTQNLLATLPAQLSVVHLVNSGSEANELALRMAKAFNGGDDVIALESGYHGNSNACINISSYKFDGKGGQGAPNNTHIVPLPDSFRGRHRGQSCASAYGAYVDQIIEKLSAENKQLSAFIAESIVSCGGQIELPAGYLQQVYQSVRTAGGVCIADEVQVGCGRIGSHFWAFEPHDVVPDILTIGKPIGNGHPLAVVVCTREVADRFANGMEYFNTFGGNPVSATIGNAVLNVIKQHRLQDNALTTGHFLKQQLKQMMAVHPIIKDVRGQGLFLGFELCDDDLNPLPQKASYLADRMRDLGVLISTDGPDHNVIKIKPPISFNKNHAQELLKRLSQVFNETAMQ